MKEVETMVTKPLLKNIIDVKDVKIVDFIIKKNHIEEDTLFIHIIPFKRTRGTCPYCGKKHCPGYDTPTRNKFWRHVDLCGMKTYLVSDSNRIHCPTCGVATEKVEWAEPRAGFTKAFEDTVTWLSLHTSKKVVSAFMRCSWNSIGDCIRRAKNRVEPDPTVRYNNLVNIGVDETSHKKGYKYITTVVNLDTDEVVWISDGHGKSVFSIFFR